MAVVTRLNDNTHYSVTCRAPSVLGRVPHRSSVQSPGAAM